MAPGLEELELETEDEAGDEAEAEAGDEPAPAPAEQPIFCERCLRARCDTWEGWVCLAGH